MHFSMTVGRAWVLSLTLLLAQALGLHHSVAHGAPGTQGPGGPVHGQVVDSLPGEPHRAHPHDAQATTQPLASPGAFHADHDAGDAQCRLVDQLGHAEFLWLACTLAPLVPADRPGHGGAALVSAPAAASAPYQARGPP